MKFLFFCISISISSLLFGQKIHHEISMPQPSNHYFQIKTTLTDFSEKTLTLTLPVWSPGSYLVREFSKNINRVVAKDENGKVLPLKKTRKNQWEITKGKAKKVVVEYAYYAFELTVRTSFLDATHGYFNGVNVFMYPEGHKKLGGKLTIVPHPSFEKISIPLPQEKDGFQNDNNAKTYIFKDYDELADSPCEIGNQETFSFYAANVKHEVAMYGTANYDTTQLKIDMAKIVESTTAIFGGNNPNKEYLFIIHNVNSGRGGLEHSNSTTLSVNRWTYSPENYYDFLSLVAHEYLHVWLVKRLRPASLVDYDYNSENYTDLLWVMEGFTSYYDKLILRRAGFYSENQYLNRFQGILNWVERTIGNKVQPLSDASFDAWIKAYMPDENSSNTTVSYYSKGGLVAAVFDAMIINASKGEKSLDDFLQTLYKEYYEDKNVGITADILKKTLEDFVGEKQDDFFEKYIDGTETIPYEKYFVPIGIEVKKSENNRVELGITTQSGGGTLTISNVKSGSAAEKIGLSVNDEIIAFNGFRVDKNDLDNFLNSLQIGDEFNLIISRDKQLMSLDAYVDLMPSYRYEFDHKGSRLGEFWLREK